MEAQGGGGKQPVTTDERRLEGAGCVGDSGLAREPVGSRE